LAEFGRDFTQTTIPTPAVLEGLISQNTICAPPLVVENLQKAFSANEAIEKSGFEQLWQSIAKRGSEFNAVVVIDNVFNIYVDVQLHFTTVFFVATVFLGFFGVSLLALRLCYFQTYGLELQWQ
jgi:hypothetical protein